MEKIYPTESNDSIFIMGRVFYDEDKACIMAFPGITAQLKAKAKQVRVCIDAETEECFFNVYINGEHTQILQCKKGSHNYVLMDGKEAESEIKLVRRTESWAGNVKLLYFSTDDLGSFLQLKALAQKTPKLKILCLGNSITAGAAAEKIPFAGGGCDDSNRTSNACVSYGYLLGQKLNAQVHLIAYSGRGMVRDWEGNTDVSTVPQYYDRIIPDQEMPQWNHAKYRADIVTICVGTNDFNSEHGSIPSKEVWTSAYIGLLQKILADHPNAHIFLCDSPMHQEGTKEQALMEEYLRFIYQKWEHTKRVHMVWLSYQKGTSVDSHPTTEQHKIIEQEIYQKIVDSDVLVK